MHIRSLLKILFFIYSAAFINQHVLAVNSCATTSTTISGATTDQCTLATGNDVTIQAGASIEVKTNYESAVLNNSGTTGTVITNSGTLKTSETSTTNYGGDTIYVTGGNGGTPSTTNVRSIINSGQIWAATNALDNGWYYGYNAIMNFNSGIESIVNTGTIQTDGQSYSGAYNLLNSAIYNQQYSTQFFPGLSRIDSIDNSGTIQASSGIGITNDAGTITTLTNRTGGTISGGGASNFGGHASRGIANTGTIGTLTNESGAIIRTLSNGDEAIYNVGTITRLENSGLIEARLGANASGINTSGGTITSLVNNIGGIIEGSRSGNGYGITSIGSSAGSIGTLTNDGSIIGRISGIQNAQNITSLSNSGAITGTTQSGFVGSGGTIQNFNNSGSISGADNGIDLSGGVITALTNTGSIIGAVGIQNAGSITTLNNAQGAGNSNGALTYSGVLPTNYSIIINNTGSFGKLSVTGGTGSTAFGIATGSSVSNNHAYVGVLSGVTAGQVTNTSGTYGGYSWALSLESGSSTIWDLIFGSLIPPGPSTADTQISLANTASVLQNTFTLQNSVLANSFTYDCELFDVNNICVSAGGRNTAVSASNGLNNTSALLIAAYRPHPNYRIGAYADQNLSVNNAGSTVNLGNNTPLIGVFGAWNERLDGTGTEVKVTAAYGQKNTTVTRGVVGSGTAASEAGSGSSQLNSQGAQVIAKYGFGLADSIVVSPYVGVRYTQNNMGGYTEATSTSVTAPLTYSALNTNATTALAGVGASYKFIPQAMVFASAGVETDTNTANGTYSATGVTGLTPINFNANPVKTRPTATIGAYYDIVKNQRLGVTGIYRQEPYQAVQTTTVMATYTVGL